MERSGACNSFFWPGWPISGEAFARKRDSKQTGIDGVVERPRFREMVSFMPKTRDWGPPKEHREQRRCEDGTRGPRLAAFEQGQKLQVIPVLFAHQRERLAMLMTQGREAAVNDQPGMGQMDSPFLRPTPSRPCPVPVPSGPLHLDACSEPMPIGADVSGSGTGSGSDKGREGGGTNSLGLQTGPRCDTQPQQPTELGVLAGYETAGSRLAMQKTP